MKIKLKREWNIKDVIEPAGAVVEVDDAEGQAMTQAVAETASPNATPANAGEKFPKGVKTTLVKLLKEHNHNGKAYAKGKVLRLPDDLALDLTTAIGDAVTVAPAAAAAGGKN